MALLTPVLFNISTLIQGLLLVAPYLKGPVLIYHDNTDNDVVNTINKQLVSSKLMYISSAPHNPKINQLPPKSTILFGKSPHPLIEPMRLWWNARQNILVISHNSDKKSVRLWLETLWKLTRAAKVVVMVITDADKVEYYTWAPYHAGECTDVITPRQLYGNQFFLENNHVNSNCTLRGVFSVLDPWVLNEVDGIEPRIFHTIATSVGMKVTYKHLPPKAYVWTSFDDNNTLVNGVEMLWNGKADVVFSDMGRPLFLENYVEFLPRHTIDKILWYVPAPARYPKETIVFKAFDIPQWLLSCAVAAGVLLVTALANLFSTGTFAPDFMNSLLLFLCMPPASSYTRMKLFTWLSYVYSMHVTVIYLSSLTTMFWESPRETGIKTLEDLARSGIPIRFHVSHRQLLLYISKLDRNIKTILDSPRASFEHFQDPKSIIEEHAAIFGPSMALNRLIDSEKFYDEFGYPLAITLEEGAVTLPIGFLIAKGHPLFEILKMKTQYIFEAGLPRFYWKNFTKYPFTKIKKVTPISLRNVETSIVFTLLLLGIGLLIFCCELIKL